MAGTTLDLNSILSKEHLASQITDKWLEWDMLRGPQLRKWEETLSFLFATDTSTTTAGRNTPWKNSTTIPKMTQIADNLHAQYMSVEFPNSDWLLWEAHDSDAAIKEKRDAIQFYMENKVRESGFVLTASDLIWDYIRFGNCFAMVSYESNSVTNGAGEEIPGYVGPKMVRISPYDIVFNPTASDFTKTPKIIRSVQSLGEIKKMVNNHPELGFISEKFDVAMASRELARSAVDVSNQGKRKAYVDDGFGGIDNYYSSDYAELLWFYGDIYNSETQELLENQSIVIMDRTHILGQKTNDSWLGHAPIYHTGWRPRPDNLYHMGPLDNLVGMQYMIDKLQNAKADIYDQIIHPTIVIKGEVDEPEHSGPGAKYYADSDGDVRFLPPDATALTADNQIALLENKMEELAGAPRQSMGIRTPGEKTKFEVQTLENSANKVFIHASIRIEQTFFEPILNDMLAQGRRFLTSNEEIKLQSQDFNVDIFRTITSDDISGKGNLKPVGARHFAQQANRIQELFTALSSPIAQDPAVAVHMSGKAKARLIEDLFDLKSTGLVGDNIAIFEQQETQGLINSAQENLDVAMAGPAPEQA